MGVDIRILLPANVRVDDVAKVLAILDGVPAKKRQLGNWWLQPPCQGESYCADVDVDVAGAEKIPSCAHIDWTGASGKRLWLYHFESDNGWRLLMPRATAWNIAAGRRLIRFFGGKLDYNDCDSTSWNEIVHAKSSTVNAPNDGKPWHNLQDRLLALTPLTQEEIESADKVASYKLADK
jgi:hypothetical protein